MRYIVLQYTSLVLIILCSLGSATSAQRLRTTRRAPSSRLRLAPITAEQKEAVMDLISEAEELEITHRYRLAQFSNEADDLGRKCRQVSEQLPEGRVRTITSEMGQAYEDAGVLYGALTGTSLRARTYESANRLYREEGRETFDYIGPILRRYGVERLTPYQAQGVVLSRASALKDALQNILRKFPVARETPPPPLSTDGVTAAVQSSVSSGRVTVEQLEREAQRLAQEIDDLVRNSAPTNQAMAGTDGDWTFPKQGMQGKYNEHSKGVIYNVGDGILAGHMKPEVSQGSSSTVLVLFLVQVPKSVASNFDLALLAAHKTINLPLNERLADMVVGWENNYAFRIRHEYRFRTAGGKVAGVTLAQDRKFAIVRFLSDR